MTRMTGQDCAVLCNLINTHTHTHTHLGNVDPRGFPDSGAAELFVRELFEAAAATACKAAELTRFMKMGAPCTAEAFTRTPYTNDPAPSVSERSVAGRRDEPSSTIAPYLFIVLCFVF